MNQHLKQAIAAARAGKEAQAKVLLARVIKDEPDNVNAWFLLSSMADTEEQKVQHLEKVLELQPGHMAASQQLAELVPSLPAAEEALPEPERDATPEMFPLPEVELPEDNAPEDPDEAMAWLERLAADQGAPMDELPSMFEKETVDETADTISATPALEFEPEPEYEENDTAPEDPDEAMAWLERLAADQGAPMDELPSMFEEEAVDETADTISATPALEIEPEPEYEEDDTAPEDPDEAMAWLERLAADQGAPMDELPSMFEEEAVEESYAWLDEAEDEDLDYLGTLPTLVDEPEEDISWEIEEEEEETAVPTKTLSVSDDSYDFVSQAEGDSIPSWLVGDEGFISADTVISETAEEAEEITPEPENLPDWLNELPDEEWSGEEGEKSGQVVWKAGEGDESLKPEPPAAKETHDSKSTSRKKAEARDNTTLYMALLAVVALILILAIFYILVNQPF